VAQDSKIAWTTSPPAWWQGAPGRLWSRCGRFAVTSYPPDPPYPRTFVGFFYAAPGAIAVGGMSFARDSLADAQAWCEEKASQFPEAAR